MEKKEKVLFITQIIDKQKRKEKKIDYQGRIKQFNMGSFFFCNNYYHRIIFLRRSLIKFIYLLVFDE